MEMKIVVLASSVKFGKRCVAGYRMNGGNEFIRLGKGTHCSEISERELVVDGNMVSVGNIITVDARKLPEEVPQIENYELNKIISIDEKVISLKKLRELYQKMPKTDMIFGNTFCYLTQAEAVKEGRSLLFEEVTDLQMVRGIRDDNGKPYYKCSFTYNGRPYNRISLTSYDARKMLDQKDDGMLYFPSAFILFSLPNPFDPYVINNDKMYKYAAGFVLLTR